MCFGVRDSALAWCTDIRFGIDFDITMEALGMGLKISLD